MRCLRMLKCLLLNLTSIPKFLILIAPTQWFSDSEEEQGFGSRWFYSQVVQELLKQKNFVYPNMRVESGMLLQKPQCVTPYFWWYYFSLIKDYWQPYCGIDAAFKGCIFINLKLQYCSCSAIVASVRRAAAQNSLALDINSIRQFLAH